MGDTITFKKEYFESVILPLLQKREKELVIEIAKIDLILDAVERDDMSNLGPALIEYMNEIEKKSEVEKQPEPLPIG